MASAALLFQGQRIPLQLLMVPYQTVNTAYFFLQVRRQEQIQ